MTLNELLEEFEKQEGIAKFIETAYNGLVPEKHKIGTDKAQEITSILRYMLNHLVNCETTFKDAESGIRTFKGLMTSHMLAIVLEYERVSIALNEDLMTVHSQTKFNPIDNDDINQAPIAKDDTQFNDLDNFNAKIEVMSKSSVIEAFLLDLRSMLITMY